MSLGERRGGKMGMRGHRSPEHPLGKSQPILHLRLSVPGPEPVGWTLGPRGKTYCGLAPGFSVPAGASGPEVPSPTIHPVGSRPVLPP